MKRVLYDFQTEGTDVLVHGLLQGQLLDNQGNTIYTHAMLLYDDMGMGKSIQALDTILKLDYKEPILIVCPSQCIDVWKDEIKKFFSDVFDDIRIFVGDGVKLSNMLNVTNKSILITSYDTLRNQYKYYIEKELDVGKLSTKELEKYCLINKKSIDRISGLKGNDRKIELLLLSQSIKRKPVLNTNVLCSPFMKQTWGCLILDEVHKIKSPSSSTAKAVGFLSAKYRLGLTGTPIMNSAFDLFSIIQYGLGLFTLDWNKIQSQPNSSYCHNVLQTVSFGRSKEDVPELANNLPKRNRLDESVMFEWKDQEQVINYCNAKAITLKALEVKKGRRNVSTIWNYVQNLRQICLHKDLPGYFDENKKVIHNVSEWSKATHNTFNHWIIKRVFTLLCCFNRIGGFNHDLQMLIIKYFVRFDVKYCIQPSIKMTYIYDLLQNNDKIVVYCTFKVFLKEIMQQWLDQIGIDSVLHAGGSRYEQKKAIDQFHKDKNIRVLLIVKQSGVEGLNLQYAANVCVIMDPHFNEAVDEQAASRVYRIGQTKDVIIRKLYMAGSIDEALKIMKEKKVVISEDWTKKKENKLSLENQRLFLQEYDKVTRK